MSTKEVISVLKANLRLVMEYETYGSTLLAAVTSARIRSSRIQKFSYFGGHLALAKPATWRGTSYLVLPRLLLENTTPFTRHSPFTRHLHTNYTPCAQLSMTCIIYYVHGTYRMAGVRL